MAKSKPAEPGAGGIAGLDATSTVAEFAAKYISGRARSAGKAKAAQAEEMVLRITILPELGRKKVSALSRKDVQAFRRALRDENQATRKDAMAVLSDMMEAAESWGLRRSGTNPCTGLTT